MLCGPPFVATVPPLLRGLMARYLAVAEAGWPPDMRCLPAGRSRAALAAMLGALAAQVTFLQRPRRLRLSRLDDRKSQGADSCGAAWWCRDFRRRQLNQL